MLGRLMPFEGRFFENFNELGGLIEQASRELAALMNNYDDLVRRTSNIELLEKKGDRVTHATIELAHRTFITPLDRDDIYQLTTRMDDILDLMEGAAQCFSMYNVDSVTPEAKRLADVCVACAEKVKLAVSMLSNMDNAKKILDACHDIDELESEADHMLRSAMGKLFREEPDVRQVIKIRAVYELLEEMTDRCEDVANVIEGIVLENS